MTYQAIGYTTRELAERGRENLPEELISNTHLIYSSPAALAFNSPGAEGFGVKRAALAIPGSVMLLVAPGCCGRNTSLISNLPGYEDRFFYLNMDETDIVTGRHLKKIPQAVEDLVNSLEKKPEVVMICITCVDALLGTDMERICRRAEEKVGIPVRPSYMYALTREGRKPPMVHIRQSLYSLLEPRKKKGNVVNILGFFAPLQDDWELYDLMKEIGVREIHEISRCRNLAEYQKMAEANFNLVLNPEARFAANDFEKRLNIPPIELRRVYQIDKIRKQYQALSSILGAKLKDDAYCQEAMDEIKNLRNRYPNLKVCVGECMNGDCFELSLALTRYGIQVQEIYGTVTAENFIYVKKLAELNPNIRIYSNLEPTMIYYDAAGCCPDLTIGKDAGYYHPGVPNLAWNSDIQPFGYRGLIRLLQSMDRVLQGEKLLSNENILKNEKRMQESAGIMAQADSKADTTRLADIYMQESPTEHLQGDIRTDIPGNPFRTSISEAENGKCTAHAFTSYRKGFRRYLTPFAPDQSGAVSVLFELGGIQVICDAGGCVGNICGLDEPRWFRMRSAIFSAGLRDMDAILGRDERLVAKLADAVGKMDMNFAVIIGTPVPSVIGTDYHALKRMTERKVDIPVMAIDTNGMQLYDVGAEKAYLELFRTFAEDMDTSKREEARSIGVLGVNPMDLSDVDAGEAIQNKLKPEGWQEVRTYGMNCGLDMVRRAGEVKENLVTAPSGVKAAMYLQKRFGTPYRIWDPLAERWIPKAWREASDSELQELIMSEGISSHNTQESVLTSNVNLNPKADPNPKVDQNPKANQNSKADHSPCILIVAQQVTSHTLRSILRNKGIRDITTATWFMRLPELSEEGDISLKEEKQWISLVEEGDYDVIFADPDLWKLIPSYRGTRVDLPHFPISGRLV